MFFFPVMEFYIKHRTVQKYYGPHSHVKDLRQIIAKKNLCCSECYTQTYFCKVEWKEKGCYKNVQKHRL